MTRVRPSSSNIGKRLRGVTKLFDLDARFKEMDDVRRLPADHLAAQSADRGHRQARRRHEPRAHRQRRHGRAVPQAPGALSGLRRRAVHDRCRRLGRGGRRAIKDLGARGVQIFTNIAGQPLDEPRFEPIFAAMAEHDLPIWLHPARTAAMPDYAGRDEIALRDVVVLRLALRDHGRDVPPGVRRPVRPPSEAEDHHPPSAAA